MMNDENESKILRPSYPARLLEVSQGQFYFEKKTQNPNRIAFKKTKVKVNLPNGAVREFTAFLNESIYILYPNCFIKKSFVGIEKHLSGVYKGFWIIEEREFKDRHEELTKTLLLKLKDKDYSKDLDRDDYITKVKQIEHKNDVSNGKTKASRDKGISLLSILPIFICLLVSLIIIGPLSQVIGFLAYPLVVGGGLLVANAWYNGKD